ncbi:MAG TPA: NDP-sugar synthase [Acidimicrobiia bacterium]|nr:NDP-sugar synthase [Acidimicrobiia bacterium]
MQVRQAVLLMGGRGTRMFPLTATTPKGLLPVAGLPFVDYQIRLLASVGVEEVFLAIGTHLLVAWERYAEGRDDPVVRVAVEEAPLDTAGCVVEILDRLDDRFLVLNGDVVLEADLAGFLAGAPDAAAATLALVPVADPSAYGVVVTGPDGYVDQFVEKPPPGTEPTNTVSAGIYVLQRSALEPYERGRLSFERVVWPALAERRRLAAVTIDGHWLDIGIPEMYLETTGAVLTGATTLHHPEGRHRVAPGAVMEGDHAGAWSTIGSGAVVERGAVIEEAIVLPGARIGSHAVVRRAIVGWDAVVGADAIVTGASMIGAGAVVGDGCELAHGVRIAPGAELQPGSVTFSPPK